MTRSLVIIESPYRAPTAQRLGAHITFARMCLRDSIHRGESPIASHLLYTQDFVLDDDNPAERDLGIELGLAWRSVAHLQAFYTDMGWSGGMLNALRLHIGDFCNLLILSSPPITIRGLHKAPELPNLPMTDSTRAYLESRLEPPFQRSNPNGA